MFLHVYKQVIIFYPLGQAFKWYGVGIIATDPFGFLILARINPGQHVAIVSHIPL